MHLHRFALILTIAAIACELAWASTQCKKVVMDVHMKRCRFGIRTKRGMERFDMQKYDDEKAKWREEGPDYAKVNNDPASHRFPQKRHLSSIEVDHHIALPIVTVASSSETVKVPRHSARYHDIGPSLTKDDLDQLGYPTDRELLSFLSTAFRDNLGFDLNPEELNELYDNFCERLPRASKEEAWKVFLDTAAKCCQNVDRCLKEDVHVPCLTH